MRARIAPKPPEGYLAVGGTQEAVVQLVLATMWLQQAGCALWMESTGLRTAQTRPYPQDGPDPTVSSEWPRHSRVLKKTYSVLLGKLLRKPDAPGLQQAEGWWGLLSVPGRVPWGKEEV